MSYSPDLSSFFLFFITGFSSFTLWSNSPFSSPAVSACFLLFLLFFFFLLCAGTSSPSLSLSCCWRSSFFHSGTDPRVCRVRRRLFFPTALDWSGGKIRWCDQNFNWNVQPAVGLYFIHWDNKYVWKITYFLLCNKLHWIFKIIIKGKYLYYITRFI